MKLPDEHTDPELIGDLREEAAVLRRKNLKLESDNEKLRRDLHAVRRNPGYRLVKNIARALKPIARVLAGNGSVVHFPRPRQTGANNGFAGERCSDALKRLLEPLAFQGVCLSSPTARNWALCKLLARKAAVRWCFGDDKLKGCISQFFAVPERPLACPPGQPTFAHFDLVIIDNSDPGILWPLLKGRFWPHQKILFHGAKLAPEFAPTRSGKDFLFYAAPPAPWLDPRHEYLPAFGPWKSARKCLPARLPGGNPWPKISIVTPSYNQGRFIVQTFDSVLGQNYPNVEYLVLDGGSTDETPAILNRYRPRLAFSWSQKDKGQADAINKGFARSSGEIMAWLNSDDQYAPDALMHVALAFDMFPEVDIVVGGCGILQGEPVPKRIHHCALPVGKVTPLPPGQLLDLENCWLKGDFFYQPEVFWRRRIWEAAGAHVADDLYYCFDYDLWVRMAQAGAKVLHIPELLALFRVHPDQKTHGDHLPYLPELQLVKSRRDPAIARNDVIAKA